MTFLPISMWGWWALIAVWYSLASCRKRSVFLHSTDAETKSRSQVTSLKSEDWGLDLRSGTPPPFFFGFRHTLFLWRLYEV